MNTNFLFLRFFSMSPQLSCNFQVLSLRWDPTVQSAQAPALALAQFQYGSGGAAGRNCSVGVLALTVISHTYIILTGVFSFSSVLVSVVYYFSIRLGCLRKALFSRSSNLTTSLVLEGCSYVESRVWLCKRW